MIYHDGTNNNPEEPWLSRKETLAIPGRNRGYPGKKPWLSQKETLAILEKNLAIPARNRGYPRQKHWLSWKETLDIPERTLATRKETRLSLKKTWLSWKETQLSHNKKHISNSNSRNNLSLPKLLTNIVYHVELSCKWRKFLNEDNSYFCQ